MLVYFSTVKRRKTPWPILILICHPLASLCIHQLLRKLSNRGCCYQYCPPSMLPSMFLYLSSYSVINTWYLTFNDSCLICICISVWYVIDKFSDSSRSLVLGLAWITHRSIFRCTASWLAHTERASSHWVNSFWFCFWTTLFLAFCMALTIYVHQKVCYKISSLERYSGCCLVFKSPVSVILITAHCLFRTHQNYTYFTLRYVNFPYQ